MSALAHASPAVAYAAVVAASSCAARRGASPPSGKFILAYNLLNAALNAVVVGGLAGFFLAGFALSAPYDAAVERYVFLHLCLKGVDFIDTVLIVLRKRPRQLSFLHLWHHATIGCMWSWVFFRLPRVGVSFAFGAFANSAVHVLVYLHYAAAAAGVRNPARKCITGVQLAQFVLVGVHAWEVGRARAGTPDTEVFALCAAGTVAYMCTMVALFGHFFATDRPRRKQAKLS